MNPTRERYCLGSQPEFWIATEAAQFSPERLALVPAEVSQLLDLAAANGCRPKCVLDMGCGLGQHVAEFSRRHHGIVATGVDITAEFIERARLATRALPLARYVCQDIREYLQAAENGSVDLIYCLYTTVVGYFAGEDNYALWRQIRRILSPGGLVIVDAANRARFRLLEPKEFCSVSGERITLTVTLGNVDQPATLHYQIERPSELPRSIETQTWLFNQEQLVDQLRCAELHRINIYGGLDMSTFDPSSSARLVVVAGNS